MKLKFGEPWPNVEVLRGPKLPTNPPDSDSPSAVLQPYGTPTGRKYRVRF